MLKLVDLEVFKVISNDAANEPNFETINHNNFRSTVLGVTVVPAVRSWSALANRDTKNDAVAY
jgi:hypothetical protein